MALRNQEIGERLRELRGQRPQTDVADKLGVSERAYQNWEAGDAKPSYRNLQRLAEFYGVGEEYILTGEGAPAPVTNGDSDTPSPFAGSDALTARLDRLEQSLRDARRERREQTETLDRAMAARTESLNEAMEAHADRLNSAIDRILGIATTLEAAVGRGEVVTHDAESATRHLLVAVAEANRALRAVPRQMAGEPERRA